MGDLLPENLRKRLEAFMKDAGTGRVEMHIKDGSVLAWDIHESHREK